MKFALFFSLLCAVVSSIYASPYKDAVQKALAAYKGEPAKDAAAARFQAKDYRLIQVGGYSIYTPGDFPLGADLLFTRLGSVIFPTNDTPEPEEVRIFEAAHEFAKNYNETMVAALIEHGILTFVELEFQVIEDTRLLISDRDNQSILLRFSKGIRRTIWLQNSKDLQVQSGQIEIIQEKKRGPNQSLVPTTMSVTSDAFASAAPATVAAHF